VLFTLQFCSETSDNLQVRFLKSFLVASKFGEVLNSPIWIQWTVVIFFTVSSFYYLIMISVSASKAFGCRCNIACLDCCGQAVRLMIAAFLPLFIIMVLAPILVCFVYPFIRNQNQQPQAAAQSTQPSQQEGQQPEGQSSQPKQQPPPSQDMPADQSPPDKV
jgi:hypothetical protein